MAQLLTNACFLTMDAVANPQCVLVDGDSIVHVGDIAGAELLARQSGMALERIDLGGRTVVPGLIDMHAHLDREGLKQSLPSMDGLTSRQEVLARIEVLARNARPGEWIVTMPIGTPPFYLFADPRDELALYPTRFELDDVAPENPVYIRPLIGFWRWSPLPELLITAVNSLAMEWAGISHRTVPPSPSVQFEQLGGQLSGRIFERSAISIVEFTHFGAALRFSRTDRRRGLLLSQQTALEAGITTVFEGHGLDEDVLGAYRGLHQDGQLAIRMECVASPRSHGLGTTAERHRLAHWQNDLAGAGIGDDMLRIRGLFVNPIVRPDDIVRSCACAHTGMVGYNFATGLPPPDLQALIERAAADNMRLVGLSTELFDSYREIQPGQLQPGHGWLIQHRSLFTRPQQRLSEDLGIGTTFLPVEAIYKQGALSAQPENAADWMPLARVLDAGLPVSIATDNIPVSLFFAIWCCLARTDYQGRSFPSDEGTISRLQAMEIATIAAARCLGRQDRIGSLSVGKLADLAVLNDDYLHCDLAAIADIRSVATMVGGRWRHDRLGLQVQADGRAPRQATLSKSSPIMGHGTPIALPGC